MHFEEDFILTRSARERGKGPIICWFGFSCRTNRSPIKLRTFRHAQGLPWFFFKEFKKIPKQLSKWSAAKEEVKRRCGPARNKRVFLFFYYYLRFCTSQTSVKRVSLIHRTILNWGWSGGVSVRMVRWCIRLTILTLVCEVIRYRLVQVQQNLKKKKKNTFWVGGPQSPFTIFLSLLRLISFLSQTKIDSCCLQLVRWQVAQHCPRRLIGR